MQKFEPITLQRIIDLGYQKFIVEGAPPAQQLETPKSFVCKYLTADGRSCVVGLALPPGHPALRVSCPFSRLVKLFPDLFDDTIQSMPGALLDEFQKSLHDGLCHLGCWAQTLEERKKAYLRVAKHYKLRVPGEGWSWNKFLKAVQAWWNR